MPTAKTSIREKMEAFRESSAAEKTKDAPTAFLAPPAERPAPEPMKREKFVPKVKVGTVDKRTPDAQLTDQERAARAAAVAEAPAPKKGKGK
jgi:hypothetical protein